MCDVLLTTAALLLAARAGRGADQEKQKGGKPTQPTTAPPKLKTTEFPDGTGTIGLPPGWRIQESYRGAVVCLNPDASQVTMGLGQVIGRPNHPANNMGIPTQIPMARDGDLEGGIRAILAKGGGRVTSMRSRPGPPGGNGTPGVYYLYEFEKPGKRISALGYFAAITEADQTLPYWQLFTCAVLARKEYFMRDLPAMMAMWGSWRPNGAKPKPGSDGAMIDAVIADNYRRRAQTLKEQQEAFDRMNAKFRETL